jgi:excisionase family DNA binding protein
LEPDVLTVRETAEKLGVSAQRVRQLISDGKLPARRSTAGWLIRSEAVADRAGLTSRGRPISPRTAWAVIDLLADKSSTLPPPAGQTVGDFAEHQVRDRKLRHQALKLLNAMPDPEDDINPWRTLLSSRGPVRRMWVHPGILEKLEADSRISVGGAGAILAIGEGLTHVSKVDLYAKELDVEQVIADYHMRPDEKGQVIIHVVPASVPPALAPQHGHMVSTAAAAADLLDEKDSRANYAALLQLCKLRNSLIHSSPPRKSTRPSSLSQDGAESC